MGTGHAPPQGIQNREDKKKNGRKEGNSGKPGAGGYTAGTVSYLHVRHRSAHWPKTTAQLMHGCISQRWRLMASCFSFSDSGSACSPARLAASIRRYGGRGLRLPSNTQPCHFANAAWMEPFGTPAVTARGQLLEAAAFQPSVPELL
ncbi:hypothetical protein HDV57DRAFT_281440 [Trichoderma longibrachiatum]